MTTAVRHNDLQTVAELIEERLHSQLPENLPLRIRCALKGGNLLVLGEHSPEVKLEVQRTFRTLKQAILALVPQLKGELRLYLRLRGQKQPYAYHAFRSAQPLGAVGSPRDDEPVLLPKKLGRSPMGNQPPEELSAEAIQARDLAIAAFPLNPFDMPPPDSAFEQTPPPVEKFRPPQWSRPRSKSWPKSVYGGVFLALAGGAIVAYAVSRPCVLRQCREILTADELTIASANTLNQAQYIQQLVESRDQLTAARDILTQIPLWSRHFPTRERLLQRNRTLSEGLDEMILALQTGLDAVEKGENPPHRAEVWQAVAQVWRQAIAALESVESDSPVYPLAQEKLSNYRANLAEIELRIDTEKTANAQFQQARKAANVAKARSGVARSFDSWEKVYFSWEGVIAQLEALPQETMAHQEAKELLPEYRAQLALARDRKMKEKIAEDAYNQALLEADLAAKRAQENQWSLTVARWNQAIAYAEQVPTGTFYYPKVAGLIKEYKTARDEAKVKLEKAVRLQKARADLKKTCEGKPTVCEYTVTDNLISVWLTADYLNKLQETTATAQKKNDPKIRQGVDEHVNTLKSALEAIADNARLTLEVYNPYGSLIGRYSPQ